MFLIRGNGRQSEYRLTPFEFKQLRPKLRPATVADMKRRDLYWSPAKQAFIKR